MMTETMAELHWFGTSNTTPPNAKPQSSAFSTSPARFSFRISFNVATQIKEVVAVLNRKTFEATLVHMSFSRCAIVGVVTHGVRDPPQEMAHSSVLAGLHHQMPMIGHQLTGQD
tara:strand:- start:223 stop:564 length:342 start_codon:yes stop_codon:yes gene_type:complete